MKLKVIIVFTFIACAYGQIEVKLSSFGESKDASSNDSIDSSPSSVSTNDLVLSEFSGFDQVEFAPSNQYIFNNDFNSALETTVQLSVQNRTIDCSIDNLIPNNGYMINYFRNNIQFAFYRIRSNDVIFSTMNMNQIPNFYATQKNETYPSYSVRISSDSNQYGSYQCSVEILANEDEKKIFNSNQVHVYRDKPLTPTMRWKRFFPHVKLNYTFDYPYFENETVYQANCLVIFNRPVEDYDVCFIVMRETLGCYEVHDYGKDVKWQYKYKNVDSKITILENEAEANYPDFPLSMKYLPVDVSSWCKVEVGSKKHPIRFASNSVSLYKKNPGIDVSYKYLNPYYKSDSAVKCQITFTDEVEYTGFMLFLLNGENEIVDSTNYDRLNRDEHNRKSYHYSFTTRGARCQIQLLDGRKFSSK